MDEPCVIQGSRQLERACGYDLTEVVNKSKVLAVSVARSLA